MLGATHPEPDKRRQRDCKISLLPHWNPWRRWKISIFWSLCFLGKESQSKGRRAWCCVTTDQKNSACAFPFIQKTHGSRDHKTRMKSAAPLERTEKCTEYEQFKNLVRWEGAKNSLVGNKDILAAWNIQCSMSQFSVCMPNYLRKAVRRMFLLKSIPKSHCKQPLVFYILFKPIAHFNQVGSYVGLKR